MLKKTIEYQDYDGVDRKEDFYFNLTTAELAQMELSIEGGLEKKIEQIVQAKDGAEIIRILNDIIERSYGVKSPDGRRFIKSKEVFEEFHQTEAYSIMFMELALNADAAALFINGIMPKIPAEPPKG